MPGCLGPFQCPLNTKTPFVSSKPFCPWQGPICTCLRVSEPRGRSGNGFMMGQGRPGRAPGGCRGGAFWNPAAGICLSLQAPPPAHAGQREAGLSGASSQDAAGLPDPGKASRWGWWAPPPPGKGSPWVSTKAPCLAWPEPLCPQLVTTGQPEWSSPKQTGHITHPLPVPPPGL